LTGRVVYGVSITVVSFHAVFTCDNPHSEAIVVIVVHDSGRSLLIGVFFQYTPTGRCTIVITNNEPTPVAEYVGNWQYSFRCMINFCHRCLLLLSVQFNPLSETNEQPYRARQQHGRFYRPGNSRCYENIMHDQEITASVHYNFTKRLRLYAVSSRLNIVPFIRPLGQNHKHCVGRSCFSDSKTSPTCLYIDPVSVIGLWVLFANTFWSD